MEQSATTDAHEFSKTALSNLFNMPSYSVSWALSWPKTQRSAHMIKQGHTLAIKKNHSLLAFYFRENGDLESPNARYPNVSRLRQSVQDFGTQYIANGLSPRFDAVRRNTTLLVHVRSGDGSITPDFVQCALNMSLRYNNFYGWSS